MKIDEHSIAAGAQPAHDPFLAPHTAALLQTAIVGLGSVARFFLNDLRVSETQRGKSRVLSIALGVLSYLGATAIWVVTTANLLYQVGWPSEKTTYPAREDSEVLWALAMYSRMLKRGSAGSTRAHSFARGSVQSGYALMSLVQILWLNFAATDLEPGEGYELFPRTRQTSALLDTSGTAARTRALLARTRASHTLADRVRLSQQYSRSHRRWRRRSSSRTGSSMPG